MKTKLIILNLIILPILFVAHENKVIDYSDGLDNDGGGRDNCFEAPLILTGQNQIGNIDSLWEVSDVFSVSPVEIPVSGLPVPDASSIAWNSAVVIARCASTWVNPQTFPSPANQANWITHSGNQGCVTGSTSYSHYYYRTRFSFPCSCIEEAVPIDSSYIIALDVYADNLVLAVYVNGELQNIPTLPGGNFLSGGQVQVELNGPWQPGENTITFLIRNNPGSQFANPQGFLAVLSPDADSDGDGVNDHLDLCMCGSHSIVDTSFVYLASCNPMDTGIVVNSFLTGYGCDSTIVVETSHLPLDTAFVSGTTCDITHVGTYCQVETSAAGCDSVICQVVTLIPPIDTTFLTGTTCDPFSTGTFCQNLTAVNGCDSIVCDIITFMAFDTTYLMNISCDPVQPDTSYQTLPNEFGCDSIIATVWVFESLDTVFLPDLAVCEGSPLSVFNTEVLADTFLCQVLNTTQGCDSTICVQVDFLPLDTTYQVLSTCDSALVGMTIETFTNLNGCDSIVITDQIFSSLDTFFLPDILLCEGESAIVFGTVVDASGQFCKMNSTVSGCDSLTCQDVKVRALPIVTVDPQQSYMSLGEQVMLNVSIIQGSISQVSWFPGNGLDCDNCLSVMASPEETTNYQITIIDTSGCLVSLSARVEVKDNVFRLFLPNVFSPNKDGINDRFTIFANAEVEVIKSLRIFDRWGSNVFDGSDLEPGEVSMGWDGMHRGEEAKIGVYVFFAELVLTNGKTKLVKGEVLLTR